MNLKQQIQEDFKASVKAKFLLIIGLCLVIGACGNNVQSPVDASFDSVAEAVSTRHAGRSFKGNRNTHSTNTTYARSN